MIRAVLRKELAATWSSPVPWVAAAVFHAVLAVLFVDQLQGRAQAVVQPLFPIAGLLLVVVVPVLAARSFAEERRTANLDVLLALLGTSTDGPVDGDTVRRRLDANGRGLTPGRLLTQLLAFEASGHVEVIREHGYRFRLTALGEEAAYDLGPGDPIDVVLVMVDLVGFVAFTAAHGDNAAHHAARQLQDLGDAELRASGGKLVKRLGDGFLGTVRTTTDGVSVVRGVARRCVRPDGQAWAIRAAVHHGRPISFRGDLFGADVNLAARLVSAAAPGELVMTTAPTDPASESLAVRGLSDPIAVTRVAVP